MANFTRRRSVSVPDYEEVQRCESGQERTGFSRETTMRNMMRMEGPKPSIDHQHRSKVPLQEMKNLMVQRTMQKTDKPRRSSSEAPGNRRLMGVSMATQFYSRFKGVLSNLVRPRVEESHSGDVEPKPILPVASVSDERCNEVLADNVLYMYAYQCLPLNLDKSEFSERKRTVYYAWLHEIWSYHICYHPTNSFFIAVHLLDRFIGSLTFSQMKDEEKNLESAGLAALQLAVKFETQCPLAEDLVRAFKIAEINHYERVLLERCDFDLGRHTVMDMMRLALEAITPVDTRRDHFLDERHAQAKLLSILSVFSPQLVAVKPSLVAAAIARLLVYVEFRPWTPEMQEMLQHSAKEVYPVLVELVAHIDLTCQSKWAGKDLIKFWRDRGADVAIFTEPLLADVCRLCGEEAEQF